MSSTGGSLTLNPVSIAAIRWVSVFIRLFQLLIFVCRTGQTYPTFLLFWCDPGLTGRTAGAQNAPFEGQRWEASNAPASAILTSTSYGPGPAKVGSRTFYILVTGGTNGTGLNSVLPLPVSAPVGIPVAYTVATPNPGDKREVNGRRVGPVAVGPRALPTGKVVVFTGVLPVPLP